MEALKEFLKYPQIPLILGVILIFTAFFEVLGIAIFFLKIKLSFGILILGIYHVIRGISTVLDSD